jgi:hypothetical protein
MYWPENNLGSWQHCCRVTICGKSPRQYFDSAEEMIAESNLKGVSAFERSKGTSVQFLKL